MDANDENRPLRQAACSLCSHLARVDTAADRFVESSAGAPVSGLDRHALSVLLVNCD